MDAQSIIQNAQDRIMDEFMLTDPRDTQLLAQMRSAVNTLDHALFHLDYLETLS